MDQSKLLTKHTLLGLQGIVLPFNIIISNWWFNQETEILPSLSMYYHSNVRHIFMGLLFSLGITFIAISVDYEWRNRTIATIAGLSAYGIALFPIHEEGQAWNISTDRLASSLHLLSAIVFYGCLIYFAWYIFPEVEENKSAEKINRSRIRWYKGSAIGMGICMTFIFMLGVILDQSIFWWEAVANAIFGIVWLIYIRSRDRKVSIPKLLEIIRLHEKEKGHSKLYFEIDRPIKEFLKCKECDRSNS